MKIYVSADIEGVAGVVYKFVGSAPASPRADQ